MNPLDSTALFGTILGIVISHAIASMATAQSITAIAPGTVARSDRIVVEGAGFGAQTGSVVVGGQLAAISEWTNTRITAYPIDSTPLGVQGVQVTTAPPQPATSNSVNVTVLARSDPDGAGRVTWRFRADGLYIESRPVVGSDGTIYAADIHGRVYAIEPDGGIKWIFYDYPPFCHQPLDVGPDGTIYMASLSSIIAINPDGTKKWRFSDPGYLVFAGPAVGPDGNIYAANHDWNQGGLGAFSLTPEGALRWSTQGFFEADPEHHGIQIVFDAFGQMYFSNNASASFGGSLYAMTLDGDMLWVDQGDDQQPAISPDGERLYAAVFHPSSPASLLSYDSEGDIQCFKFGAAGGGPPVTGAPDVGIDGNVYVGLGMSAIASINPGCNSRWQVNLPGNPIRYAPIASLANQVVVVNSYMPMAPGHVWGLAPQTGQVLWSVQLPFENGAHVWPMSRLRFSDDGQSVFLGTTHNNYLPDPYSYLYAIDASDDSGAPGDATGDGVVNVNDLLAVINAWGVCPTPGSCAADVNSDGVVDVDDLLTVINNWG